MEPYFLIWGAIAVAVLSARRHWDSVTSFGVWLACTLLIGLRDQVGGDWRNYLPYYDRQIGQPFNFALESDEAGYAISNWLAASQDWGVYGANILCGGIFSLGLVIFCRAQPRPWLALALAFPYLIVVVAMGYSRQGVAIGLEMLALLALEQNRLLPYLTWIALAATFHKTALVMLIAPALTLSGNLRFFNLLRLALLGGTALGLYNTFLADSVDTLQRNYIEAGYQSQGALIRVVLCLLPALIFLWQRHAFPVTPQQRRLWTVISLMAVGLAIWLVVSPSSTAVDRIGLYLIPLQLFVGSRLPELRLQGLPPGTWNQLLLAFSLAVLAVWLLFATHSFAWVPYRNLLLPF
ncbi:EpsG family protein [Synechococcus elongatus]|uniref:EpsG family protein n=1 Tax=Synechococcus elongatus TaxID=32046 RepID=UPI0030CDA5C2